MILVAGFLCTGYGLWALEKIDIKDGGQVANFSMCLVYRHQQDSDKIKLNCSYLYHSHS